MISKKFSKIIIKNPLKLVQKQKLTNYFKTFKYFCKCFLQYVILIDSKRCKRYLFYKNLLCFNFFLPVSHISNKKKINDFCLFSYFPIAILKIW